MSKKKLILIAGTAFSLLLGVAVFFSLFIEAQFTRGLTFSANKLLLPLTLLLLLPCVLLISSLYSKYGKNNGKILALMKPIALLGMTLLIPKGGILQQGQLIQNGLWSFVLYNCMEYAIWRLITAILKEGANPPGKSKR
jgi:hypothetical protein